jgi:peptidoglycan biosynthesis protein MviN/MurJ (putative lipid II flippase)
MGARSLSLRRAALLIGAAFAVHQLRFVVSYGHGAGRVLDEPGHRYLPFAGAAAAVLLLLAAWQFAAGLLGRRAPAPDAGCRLGRLWGENALALVAIYVTQEAIEGAFAPGHPVWAHGGWTVVPLAIVIGALIALVSAGADHALVKAAQRASTQYEHRRISSSRWRAVRGPHVVRDALARHLAGRAPPVPLA